MFMIAFSETLSSTSNFAQIYVIALVKHDESYLWLGHIFLFTYHTPVMYLSLHILKISHDILIYLIIARCTVNQIQ